MHLVGYQVVCSFSNDSGTGVFLWIWRNFTEYLFYRTPLDDCFDVDPFGFPGFCSAPKIPCVISFGCYPVSSILLYISAIFSGTTSDDYFISSTLIWFIPRHLLFFRVHTAFLISDDVNSGDIGVGNTFYNCSTLALRLYKKCFRSILL